MTFIRLFLMYRSHGQGVIAALRAARDTVRRAL